MIRTADFFAGVGGIKLGFEQAGKIKNVFSAEIDKFACKIYESNFGENPYCDVTKLNPEEIPDFDILLAGFPCQPFSHMGRKKGFADTRGTLFFDIARITEAKKPAVVFLENVKGFLSHDRGKTFATVKRVLEELEYKVFYEVLNSKDYGVPQNRQRLYIVAFRNDLKIDSFNFPDKSGLKSKIEDILEPKVSCKYYLSEGYLKTLKKHKERNEKKGNGFGYAVIIKGGVANTLTASLGGRDRNLVARPHDIVYEDRCNKEINKEFIRYLTPREYARIQGFRDNFKIPVSDSRAYKCFGNSVSVPVVRKIAEKIFDKLA